MSSGINTESVKLKLVGFFVDKKLTVAISELLQSKYD